MFRGGRGAERVPGHGGDIRNNALFYVQGEELAGAVGTLDRTAGRAWLC
jgi:hypothetical protein